MCSTFGDIGWGLVAFNYKFVCISSRHNNSIPIQSTGIWRGACNVIPDDAIHVHGREQNPPKYIQNKNTENKHSDNAEKRLCYTVNKLTLTEQ